MASISEFDDVEPAAVDLEYWLPCDDHVRRVLTPSEALGLIELSSKTGFQFAQGSHVSESWACLDTVDGIEVLEVEALRRPPASMVGCCGAFCCTGAMSTVDLPHK